jgi:hypothetical protein
MKPQYCKCLRPAFYYDYYERIHRCLYCAKEKDNGREEVATIRGIPQQSSLRKWG